MAPSLINSYPVYSAGNDTSTLTTPSFSPAAGEVIVVKATTYDTNNGMATPTDSASALTWTHVGTAAPGGFNGWAGVWVATVGSAPGSITISCAPATSTTTRHSMVVERWGSAKVAASPATNSTVSGSGTTASTTLTTVSANSVVSWCMTDESSNDPANSTYLSSATQDGLYDGHVGSNSVQYFAYQSAPSAGSQTFGVTSSSGTIKWAMVGVEVQAGSNVTNVAAADSFTTSDSPARALSLPRGPGDSFTTSDAPSRSVTLPRSPADAVTTTDSPTRAVTLPRGTADSFTTSDVATCSIIRGRTTADAFTTSDSPARALTLARALADAFTTTDTPTRVLRLIRGVADAFTTADTATARFPGLVRVLVVSFGPPSLRWTFTTWQGVQPMGSTKKVIDALSTEPYQVAVDGRINGVPINITNDVVQMAFMPTGVKPTSSNWQNCTWETITAAGETIYVADCQIGPNGGLVLASGTYSVWVKVVDNPDVPVRQVGLLQIT